MAASRLGRRRPALSPHGLANWPGSAVLRRDSEGVSQCWHPVILVLGILAAPGGAAELLRPGVVPRATSGRRRARNVVNPPRGGGASRPRQPAWLLRR